MRRTRVYLDWYCPTRVITSNTGEISIRSSGGWRVSWRYRLLLKEEPAGPFSSISEWSPCVFKEARGVVVVSTSPSSTSTKVLHCGTIRRRQPLERRPGDHRHGLAQEGIWRTFCRACRAPACPQAVKSSVSRGSGWSAKGTGKGLLLAAAQALPRQEKRRRWGRLTAK